jgi:uncharacterized protein (DUF305 family)
MRLLFLTLFTAVSVAFPTNAGAQATSEARSADEICGQVAEGTPGPGGATTADPGTMEFDLIFLEAMIPHHQATIDLATIARQRSQRPEVREFAGQVITGREVELSAMSTWRREWYPGIPTLAPNVLVEAVIRYMAESPGVGAPAGLEDMGPEHDGEAITTICTADEVDLAFIDALIARNSGSMILANKAAEFTTHRDIREMALSMAETQQFEIDQALAWRDQWFPDASPPAHDSG